MEITMKHFKTLAITLLLTGSAFASISDLQDDVEIYTGQYSLINSVNVKSDDGCYQNIDSKIRFDKAYEGPRVNILLYKSFETQLEENRASDRAFMRRSTVYANAGFKKDSACPNLGLSETVSRVSYDKKENKITIKKFNVSSCGLFSHKKINERKIKIQTADNADVLKITKSRKDSDIKKTCYYQRIN